MSVTNAAAPVPTSASGAGLAFALFDPDRDLTACFDLLATQSSVKFLSTPQVMVLDNQTATIRVGDQILSFAEGEIDIISEGIEGWLVGQDGSVTVALDTEITPELRREGLARETVQARS